MTFSLWRTCQQKGEQILGGWSKKREGKENGRQIDRRQSRPGSKPCTRCGTPRDMGNSVPRQNADSEEKKTPFPSSLHFPRVEYGQESRTFADPFAVPIGGLLPIMELRSLALLAGLLMARAIAELNLLKASLRGLAMGHA